MSAPEGPETRPPGPPRDEDSAAWPFVLPMAVFLAFVVLGALDERAYPWAYAGRTLIVGALLIWLWPRLRRDIEWTHLPLGALVGVIGVFQWIGMDKLLQAVRDQFPQDWQLGGFWSLLVSGIRPGDGFNPIDQISEPAGALAFVSFLFVRTLGPVLVVPVMEELFWRNWLWRSIAAPANWRLAAVGEPDRLAIIVTCLAFSVVHEQRLVSIVWAALVAWLLVRTRSLGACIVAHAVTNLLLAMYVLVATMRFGMNSEWYFW